MNFYWLYFVYLFLNMISLFSSLRKFSSEALQAAKKIRPKTKPKKSTATKRSKTSRKSKTRSEMMETGGAIGQEPSRYGVLDNTGKTGSF